MPELSIATIAKEIAEGLLSEAHKNLRRKRAEIARNILIKEIRLGENDFFEACEVDEAVAIVDRYMRAAQEGTAAINLRLLAKVIAGQKHFGTFKANNFLYYADVVSSLSREEIILLGSMLRHAQSYIIHTSEGSQTIETHPDRIGPLLYAEVGEELIPTVFANNEDYAATASAIMRTGLLISVPMSLGVAFRPTPLLKKIAALASFEDVLVQDMGSEEVA